MNIITYQDQFVSAMQTLQATVDFTIPVTPKPFDDWDYGVDARELHGALGTDKHFSDWFKQQAERLPLNDGVDFRLNPLQGENSGRGRPPKDYMLTLDAAKHVALAATGERGQKVRQYFIAVEKLAIQEMQRRAPAEEARPAEKAALSHTRLFFQSAQAMMELEQKLMSIKQQVDTVVDTSLDAQDLARHTQRSLHAQVAPLRKEQRLQRERLDALEHAWTRTLFLALVHGLLTLRLGDAFGVITVTARVPCFHHNFKQYLKYERG